ncbi:TonB-dependent receptor [Acanthopleuribacter pedis]|uniref:TonB-dependent receptor plug domain-containing protein n=1 Tax=Acanthopleuribacter pedis TaxID=442870 RepID=A0A8J7U7K6_9BACT|nr:TonB-dependent receptor [Acanthopleuribacter pedis]MBO1322618.1 TonB-dependent receptor plug domain-containing protein [Acanthopleuribacter pedis]
MTLLLWRTCLVALLLLCLPLSAQTTETETKTRDTTPSAETAETIVVTAQKRETDLQKTALAVTVLDPDQVAMKSTPDIRALAETVPFVHLGVQEGNFELNIRGIGSSNNTELGDPAAALHIDGVYIPRPRGSGAMFFDIERVEVLRGPQGTLYGRNATAGTMNLISKKPQLGRFAADVELSLGNYNDINSQAMANIPINGQTAVRFAGMVERHDPYLENSGSPVTNVTGTEDADDRAFRVQWLWQADSRVSLLVGYDHVMQDGNGYSGINEFGGRAEDPRITNYFDQLVHESENSGISAVLTWNLTESLQLVGQLGQRSVDYLQETGANSATSTQLNYSKTFWDSHSDSDTLELRLMHEGDRLRWTLGAFGFDEEQDVFLGNTADRSVVFAGTVFDQPVVESESRALFGEMTFRPNERHAITAGLRTTRDEKFREGTGHIILFQYNDGDAYADGHRFGTPGFRWTGNGREVGQYGQLDTLDDLMGADESNDFVNFGEADWDHTDFKLAYEFTIDDEHLVYLSSQSGYKAGGFNDGDQRDTGSDVVANNLFTYEPETLIAYELGSKNLFLDRRLRANFALFHYDYQDQQFSTVRETPAGGRLLLTTNAADSVNTGLEWETTWYPAGGFQVDFSGVWMQAEFDRFNTVDTRVGFNPDDLPTIDLSGRKLPKAPDWTARLGISQRTVTEFGGVLRWRAAAYSRDDHYLNIFNDAADRVAGYTLFEAGLGYTSANGKFEVDLFGANLGDETYRTSLIQTPSLLLGFYNVPRTYGLRLKVAL